MPSPSGSALAHVPSSSQALSDGEDLRVGGGQGPRVGAAGRGKWGAASTTATRTLSHQHRPVSAIGFRTAVSHGPPSRNDCPPPPDVDVLHVGAYAGDVEPPSRRGGSGAQRPASGLGGSLVRGLPSRAVRATLRPHTAAAASASRCVVSANNPGSTNPTDTETFFLTSVEAGQVKPDVQGDLVKIAHPVAESAQIHDSGDWVSNAPGKAWKKPVSDAIGSAKLGPQSALAGHMGQRTNACQEDGFDEGEMERERFKWVPLPESLPPPPSLMQFVSMKKENVERLKKSISEVASVFTNGSIDRITPLPGGSQPKLIIPCDEIMAPVSQEDATSLTAHESVSDSSLRQETVASPALKVSLSDGTERSDHDPVSAPRIKRVSDVKDVPKRENTIAETQKQIKQQQHRRSIETRAPQYYHDRALKEGMLKKCDYIKTFSDKQIAIVAAECQIQEFKPADLIVREHDRALCMYILQAGEVGEYKNFPQPSALRTVDPWLMKDKRTQVFNTQNHVFCALSLFLGVPAASTYAAMKATIMLRVPVTAIQPVLANSRELVNYVAVMLLTNPSLATDQQASPDTISKQRKNLANAISAFQEGFTRTHPGGSWTMTPRSRAKQPRALEKAFDIAAPEDREDEEIAPCVGRKPGVVAPCNPRLSLKNRPYDEIENAHLSPRYLMRDQYNKGGVVTNRLSRRPLQEALDMMKSRSGIPRLPEGEEDWNLQATAVVDKPIVTRPGTAPAPVHAILGSRGTTKEALEELERVNTSGAEVKTKMGRDLRWHLEIMKARNNIKTPFDAALRSDPQKPDMKRQLQYDSLLATRPTAFACGREQTAKEEAQRLLEHKQKEEEIEGMIAGATFSCEMRQTFRKPEFAEMIQHPQYHSRRDELASKREGNTFQPAMELYDERLKCKFTNPVSALAGSFPPKPAVQMYRNSKYHLMKEVGMIPPRNALANMSPGRPMTPFGATVRLPKATREEILDASREDLQELITRHLECAPTWDSTFRAADTTGLMPRAALQKKTRPSFSCRLRQEAPYTPDPRTGVPVLKETHEFSKILGEDPSAKKLPMSTSQEANTQTQTLLAEQKLHPQQAVCFNRTWMQELQTEEHENDMFSLLKSADYRPIARKGERVAFDGTSANRRAPDVDETGKPCVADAVKGRTRLEIYDNIQLNPARIELRPTWVALERQQQHL